MILIEIYSASTTPHLLLSQVEPTVNPWSETLILLPIYFVVPSCKFLQLLRINLLLWFHLSRDQKGARSDYWRGKILFHLPVQPSIISWTCWVHRQKRRFKGIFCMVEEIRWWDNKPELLANSVENKIGLLASKKSVFGSWDGICSWRFAALTSKAANGFHGKKNVFQTIKIAEKAFFIIFRITKSFVATTILFRWYNFAVTTKSIVLQSNFAI